MHFPYTFSSAGEPRSSVSVVFGDGGALHGVALLGNDTLVFEVCTWEKLIIVEVHLLQPMRRHDEKAPSDATLVYRESNWRRRDGFAGESCRAIHAPGYIPTPVVDGMLNETALNETTRQKRQATS